MDQRPGNATFDFTLADSPGLFHRASVVLTIVLVLLGVVAVASLTYIGLRSSRAAAKLKAKLERQVSKRLRRTPSQYSRVDTDDFEQQHGDIELRGEETETTHKTSSGYALMTDS